MLIYEKENKLNINFENQISNPDIEIGKGEIKVDGNDIVSGGGSEPMVVTFTDAEPVSCDKTWDEVKEAHEAGREIVAYCEHEESGTKWRIQLSVFFTYDSGEVSGMGGMFYFVAFGNTLTANCAIGSGVVSASTTGFTID